MKKLIAACCVFLSAHAALALPFNPNRFKTSVSLVVLESEINDVLRELTQKSVLGLTLAPTRFNWNEMIDQAIIYRANNGGCSLECEAMRQMKLPNNSNIYVPLYIKIKSAQFDFRPDGKIFLDVTLGVNIRDEIASFSFQLETSPQLEVNAPLQMTRSPAAGKAIGTTAFQTAKLSLCTDKLATKAKLTSFSLSYSNAFIREEVMKKVQEALDQAIANEAGNCYSLTEGLLPPRSAVAKGQVMAYPVIKVSDGILELRTKVIVPKDAMVAVRMLLLQ